MKRARAGTARLLVPVLLAVAASPGWSEVYKWVDESGRVQFGDRPPPEANAERLDLPASGAGPDPTLQERRARQARLLEVLERERAEQREAQAEALDQAEERRRVCEEARTWSEEADRASLLYREDPETGERQYLGQEEADRLRAEWRERARTLCAAPP